MPIRRGLAIATLTVMVSASVAAAQLPNAPPARLATAASLTCRFSVMATGTWKEGTAESSVKPARLSVAYRAVNIDEGTAESVGDAGKSHITVRLSGNYLHFMQMEPYGALYVTTVFATAAPTGALLAVHTRHEFTPVSLPGLTSRPELYIGECDVSPARR